MVRQVSPPETVLLCWLQLSKQTTAVAGSAGGCGGRYAKPEHATETLYATLRAGTLPGGPAGRFVTASGSLWGRQI